MTNLAKRETEPTAIERREPKATPLALSISGAIQINSLESVFRLAESLAQARGFVPRHLLGDPNGIAACILTGIELGIGPMEAMRVIHMVEGKPTMAADYMLARAIRAGIRIEWEQCDDRAAVVRLTRAGARHTHAFTIAEADRAGLLGKDNWRKYPAAMLRARCVSAAMRAFCPDVLGAGVYLAEELEVVGDAPTVEVTSRPLSGHEGSAAMLHPNAAPPVRLSDVRDEEELREWCAANRESLSQLRNGRRKDCRAKISEAAGRCGVSDETALSWAGLADE